MRRKKIRTTLTTMPAGFTRALILALESKGVRVFFKAGTSYGWMILLL